MAMIYGSEWKSRWKIEKISSRVIKLALLVFCDGSRRKCFRIYDNFKSNKKHFHRWSSWLGWWFHWEEFFVLDFWGSFSIIIIVVSGWLMWNVQQVSNILWKSFLFAFQTFLGMTTKLKHDNYSSNVINMGKHRKPWRRLRFNDPIR